MSLNRQIAHNTIVQIVGKTISTVLGLAAIAIMTRYLGTEQFGWYVTTISFLQFVGILIDFGLIPVTAQMLSEEKFEKKELFHNLLGFRFVTAVFFLFLAPLVGLFFPYPPEVKIAIALSTLSFLAISMNQVLTGFFQKELKMYLVSAGEVLGRIFLVGGLYVLIYLETSFLPIMTLISLSIVVYMGVLFFFARKYITIGFRCNLAIWKAIVIKMWPITLSILFNVVYLKGDILLLSLYRSQEEVGLYGAAYRVLDIVTQIAMLSIGIFLPLLAASWTRKNKQEFKEHYHRALMMMCLLGLPLATGTFLLAKPIMHLVAGEKFAAASYPLQILSLAVIGLFIGAIYGHLAVAIDRQKTALSVYISAAVFTVIGYLIFIPKFGMIGAAWMTVFSEIFVGLGLFFLIKRYIKIPLPSLFFIKILLSTLIMAIILYLLPNIHVILSIFIGFFVYALGLFLTKAVSKDTLKEIFSLS